MHPPKEIQGTERNLRSGLPSLFKHGISIVFSLPMLLMLSLPAVHAQTVGAYQMTSILSDGYVPATVTDKNFIDPWGISIGPEFWIDTAATGFSYVNTTNGAIAFKATIPSASGNGTGQPAGTVFNSTKGFVLSNGSPASFLFGSLDGIITGWNGKLFASGNVSLVAVNNSAANAVYTDIALDSNTTGTFLLAANFGKGAQVEIYDQSFKPAAFAGTFSDPNIPTGYAPYSIHVLNNQVYVTYMLRSTSTYSATLGTNTGFVSVFDANGNFVKRAITGGNLNAPWGVALAPSTFGIYGGDLLVGNLGDGLINVYDPTTYAYLGQIVDGSGNPILAQLPGGTGTNYTGLWEIVFGLGTSTSNPSSAKVGDSNTLYFTAGLASETHGLFGSIAPSTTSTGSPAFGLSTSTRVVSSSAAQAGSLVVALAPTNGFTGNVALTCTGLPAGASCNFSPSMLTVAGDKSVTSTLSIAINSSSGGGITGYNRAELRSPSVRGGRTAALAGILLLPFVSTLLFSGRKRATRSGIRSTRLLSAALVMLGVSATLIGCSYNKPTVIKTPAGTSQVTVTATSGAISKAATFSMTVQ